MRMLTHYREMYEPLHKEDMQFACRLHDGVGTPPNTHPASFVKSIYTNPVLDSYEEITPNSQGSRREWKSFEHYKSSRGAPTTSLAKLKCFVESGVVNHEFVGESLFPYFGYPWPGYTGLSQGTDGFGDPGRPISGLLGFYEKRIDGGFVPPPSSLADLEARALRIMLPSIKEELSLINSLYELKDFKSLPHTMSRIRTGLDRMFRFRSGLTLRQGLRLGSDGYLQSQFNLLPLLSDIVGANRAIRRIEAQINELVTRSGKVQRKHFAYTWSEFEDSTDVTDPFYVMTSFDSDIGTSATQLTRYVCTRQTIHEPSKFHAMIEYNYNYSQYQRENALLLGLLDAFGVNLNPAIIWNAIPWSFVVDWVFGVNRFLSNFKVQNMEPKINIRRYLWSIARKRNIWVYRVAKHAYPGHALAAPQEVPTPVVTETAYRRHVGTPAPSLITTSGLNSTEFTLGAALVLARKPKRRIY